MFTYNICMIKLVPENQNIADIYSDLCIQFPVDELKSKSFFYSILNNPNYKFFRCYSDEKEVGYILCYVDEYIWVDYFAVYKPYQSMGYGKQILKALFEKFNRLKGVLFEVEKIDSSNVTTIRRQKFYKDMGCINSGINYLFPSYDKALPMDLLYYPLINKYPEKQDVLLFIRKVFETIHTDVDSKDIIYSKIT